MRAVVLEDHGGPEVLLLRDVPDPTPGPDEVLVRVVSSALNRADLLQRLGYYPGPPADIEIPGMEFAGRVVATGARVADRAVGDAVMGIVAGFAHAELLVVHERQTALVPEAVPLTDAGAIPEVFITAFDALVLQGGLTTGGVALVHAGASGVGTAATQIARAIGAEVIVTASASKLAACLKLGASLAIDYGVDDFVDAALGHTGGRGVDVVLDVIGGDYLDRNVRSLRVGGRIVQVGVMGGGSATLNLGMLLPRRASIVGTVLRGRPLEEKIAVTRRFEAELVPLFADRRLVPVIDSHFPLDAVVDAHRRMESNTNIGKIVLDVQPDA